MISYETLRRKPAVCKALIGLTSDAFDVLLRAFENAWGDFVKEHFIEARPRKRAFGGGRRPKLAASADKLVFILFYFRHYPTQEVQGFLFGLSQEQANLWIHRLTPMLSKALGYEAELPQRQAKDLAALLREQPALEFFLDGTERPIQRPKDHERQKRHYSGKKKRHTIKNNLITNRDRRVLYLSATVEGTRSDKTLADEEGYRFPRGSTLYQDKGFQGYEPPGVTCRQPRKKPRGGTLSAEERAANRVINQLRVRIEHAIGGVKVFQIVHDIYRNRKQHYDDTVMEAACGLHNFRCSTRAIGQVTI